MKTKYILFFLIAISFYAMYSQTSTDLAKEGFAYFHLGKYSLAIDKFSMAIQKDSLNPRYYDDRACAWQRVKLYEKAYADLNRALILNPDYILAYHHKADFLWIEGKIYESIEVAQTGLNKAKSNDSLKANLYNTIGLNNLYLKNYKDAAKYFELSIKTDSKHFPAYTNLSVAYKNSGNMDKAIKILEDCIKLDPKNASAYNNLGMRYTDKKKFNQAIICFTKSLSIDSTNSYTYNNRGFALFKAGEQIKGLADINKSIKMNLKNPYAYKNRALIYLSSNLNEEACKDLELSEKLGYSKYFDNEVLDLLNKHCK